MSAIRVCPHGCASSASCPICAPIEDRPVGLYQFAPAAGEYALRSMSAAEQLEWGMRYHQGALRRSAGDGWQLG